MTNPVAATTKFRFGLGDGNADAELLVGAEIRLYALVDPPSELPDYSEFVTFEHEHLIAAPWSGAFRIEAIPDVIRGFLLPPTTQSAANAGPETSVVLNFPIAGRIVLRSHDAAGKSVTARFVVRSQADLVASGETGPATEIVLEPKSYELETCREGEQAVVAEVKIESQSRTVLDLELPRDVVCRGDRPCGRPRLRRQLLRHLDRPRHDHFALSRCHAPGVRACVQPIREILRIPRGVIRPDYGSSLQRRVDRAAPRCILGGGSMREKIALVGFRGSPPGASGSRFVRLPAESVLTRNLAVFAWIVIGDAALEGVDPIQGVSALWKIRERVHLSPHPSRRVAAGSWIDAGISSLIERGAIHTLEPTGHRDLPRPSSPLHEWVGVPVEPGSLGSLMLLALENADALTVGAWAARHGVSERLLLTRCQQAFGMTAKAVTVRYRAFLDQTWEAANIRMADRASALGLEGESGVRRIRREYGADGRKPRRTRAASTRAGRRDSGTAGQRARSAAFRNGEVNFLIRRFPSRRRARKLDSNTECRGARGAARRTRKRP